MATVSGQEGTGQGDSWRRKASKGQVLREELMRQTLSVLPRAATQGGGRGSSVTEIEIP